MKVIKYIDAAEIAGVSRQAIYDLKKINNEGKRRYPFFCHSPETGKAGVNIDDNSWKDYLDRNRNNTVKKKYKVNRTNQAVSKAESSKSAVNNDSQNKSIINIFVPAVKSAAVEVFNCSGKQMKRFMNAIDRNLEGKL